MTFKNAEVSSIDPELLLPILLLGYPYGISRKQQLGRHFSVKIFLVISSCDADSGCSAFHRIAAVMRVRPLG